MTFRLSIEKSVIHILSFLQKCVNQSSDEPINKPHFPGMNSLLNFKEFAAGKQKWEILATEHFVIKDDESDVNATKNLLKLREQGARVILLSCSAKYVPHVLAQAEKLDMMAKGWAWILTPGAISTVSQYFNDISM